MTILSPSPKLQEAAARNHFFTETRRGRVKPGCLEHRHDSCPKILKELTIPPLPESQCSGVPESVARIHWNIRGSQKTSQSGEESYGPCAVVIAELPLSACPISRQLVASILCNTDKSKSMHPGNDASRDPGQGLCGEHGLHLRLRNCGRKQLKTSHQCI